VSLRFHERAEARHRILNPFTDDKLARLGESTAARRYLGWGVFVLRPSERT
jgi:hypothetical protein